MNQLTKINDLLQQEISRKEFLRYVGLSLLAIIGVTNLVKNLQSSLPGERQKAVKPAGYGASSYGR